VHEFDPLGQLFVIVDQGSLGDANRGLRDLRLDDNRVLEPSGLAPELATGRTTAKRGTRMR